MDCVFAWTDAHIMPDGSVYPCCARPVKFGSLRASTLQEVFCSEEANDLRRRLADGSPDHLPNACRNCFHVKRFAADYDVEKRCDSVGDTRVGLDESSPYARNLDRICQAFRAGEALQDAVPLMPIILLGEACNLQCSMCRQDHDDPTHLDGDCIQSILDCLDRFVFVTLTGGEPLVFGQSWEILDCFQRNASPVAHIGVLTNAHLLTRDRLAEHCGSIDNLIVAVNFDACTEETYNKIRVRGRWDVLLGNLHDFNVFRYRNRKDNWRLGLGHTIMKSNIHEVAGTVKLAAGLGAEQVGFGAVSGDADPVKNCRTYFEENIFRFSHLGYSKEDIARQLEAAIDSIQTMSAVPDVAVETLKGIIDWHRDADVVDIPPDEVRRMRDLADEELAEEILWYVQNPGQRRPKDECPSESRQCEVQRPCR